MVAAASCPEVEPYPYRSEVGQGLRIGLFLTEILAVMIVVVVAAAAAAAAAATAVVTRVLCDHHALKGTSEF